MIKKFKHTERNTSELITYIKNARTHSDEQILQIASSIKEFGFTNPILIDEENGVIAGHGRLMAAKKLNIDEVPCIILNGLSEAQRKAYIIADNQLALNAGWDEELLKIEIEELKDFDFDIDLLGFDDEFLEELELDLDEENEGLIDEDEDNNYSKKIKSPIYEITGDKPSIHELLNKDKNNELINKIDSSKLQEDEKDFLKYAAHRHVVFDYRNIAEYYAHSSKECQELMEDSALVIIDFNKAIDNGFVKLTDDFASAYKEHS